MKHCLTKQTRRQRWGSYLNRGLLFRALGFLEKQDPQGGNRLGSKVMKENMVEFRSSDRHFSKTKIVATVGPAVDAVSKLVELIEAGVDVFRINAAHGTPEEHEEWLKKIRQAAKESGRPIATLVDLAGPKIRLLPIPGDVFHCVTGQEVRFVRGQPGEKGELGTTYEPLVDELEPGDRVVLADGMVSLVVKRKEKDTAVCQVVQPGTVRSRQGVNLPGVKLKVPAMDDRDRERALWAARAGVDFIGLSFVRRPEDVVELKELLKEAAETDDWDVWELERPRIVAKIEKPEAVQPGTLERIIETTDVVMVARGDLGVEIDIDRLPVVQKEIIEACHRQFKPVIVATQMLESMQHSRLPTRAEATDVANAVWDGADACMLSAETAVGDYPVEAVKIMHRLALAAEKFRKSCRNSGHLWPEWKAPNVPATTQGVCYAAGHLAEELKAKAVVVQTLTGSTPLVLSKQRWSVPVVAVSENERLVRRMNLYWGVLPYQIGSTLSGQELLDLLRERRLIDVTSGDRFVVTWQAGSADSRHNTLSVHVVP